MQIKAVRQSEVLTSSDTLRTAGEGHLPGVKSPAVLWPSFALPSVPLSSLSFAVFFGLLVFEVPGPDPDPDPVLIIPFLCAEGTLWDPSEGEKIDRKEFEKLNGKHLPVTICDFPPLFMLFLPELSPVEIDPELSFFLLPSSSVKVLLDLKMGRVPEADPSSVPPRSPSMEGQRDLIWFERYALFVLYCAAGNIYTEGAVRCSQGDTMSYGQGMRKKDSSVLIRMIRVDGRDVRSRSRGTLMGATESKGTANSQEVMQPIHKNQSLQT